MKEIFNLDEILDFLGSLGLCLQVQINLKYSGLVKMERIGEWIFQNKGCVQQHLEFGVHGGRRAIFMTESVVKSHSFKSFSNCLEGITWTYFDKG